MPAQPDLPSLPTAPEQPPQPPRPPSAPPRPPSTGTVTATLEGEVEAFVSHFEGSPEQLSFSLKPQGSSPDEGVTSIPLRFGTPSATGLATGDNVELTVRVPVSSAAGRRILAGQRGAAGGGRRLLSGEGYDLSDLPELDVEDVEVKSAFRALE